MQIWCMSACFSRMDPTAKVIRQNLFSVHIVARIVATIIRRVLDWQLDLLDHTQLHTITVYTLHNSLLQLQLFSEDCCSTRILTRNWSCLLSNTKLRNYVYPVAANVRLYSLGADHKENLSDSPTVGMTSLPERPAKKTLVASIVALHGNGCKQASHCWLLTYSVHVTILSMP
jgi:hypothetical protein